MAQVVAVEAESTSATGGSARSQAANIDDRRWRPRRGLAFVVSAMTFVVPFVCATLAVQVATRFVGRPSTLVPFALWLVGLLALATITLRIVDRQAKRLLPLAAILRLSLVFPDQAPSRFSLALKSGTGRALSRSVARASTQVEFGTPQEAAEGVVALISAVGRHDRQTLGHCERVRAYSDLLGQQLHLDAESLAKLHWAALLHDVGKMDVSPSVLNKKGRLTPEEWQHVREHPAHSDKWLGGLRPWLGDWSLAARQHHERFDGAGYPDGIAGRNISLAGRIVAVADAFDVMTAARSYKKPFPAAQARVELTDNAGTQFDPDIVRAFLAISVGELRRVMGPVAWLAAVPELLRLGVTSVIEPARTAVVAAGVAAAGLVPAVANPPHLAESSIVSGAASAATDAAGEATRPDRDPGRSQGGAVTVSSSPDPGAPAAAGTSGPADTRSDPGGNPPVDVDDVVPVTPPTVPPVTVPPVTVPPVTVPPVVPVPHTPVANDDNPPIQLIGSFLVIDVLANDTDADGNINPSSVRITNMSGAAAQQSIDVRPDGKIEFTALHLLMGPTWFDYEVCDTTSRCDTARVTVRIVLGV